MTDYSKNLKDVKHLNLVPDKRSYPLPNEILCVKMGAPFPNNPTKYPLQLTSVTGEVTCHDCLKWMHA